MATQVAEPITIPAAPSLPLKPVTRELPTVELDTTLEDLYRKTSPSLAGKTIGQVFSGISAAIALTSNIPRNRKFIYQDRSFTNSNSDPAITAVKLLSLVPQRDAFISGSSPIIVFHIDTSQERKQHEIEEAEKTMAVLSPKQRPRLVFCDGPKHLACQEAGVDLIACKAVMDGIEQHAALVPFEKHWFLNSKGALAGSGLPTPNCVVLTIDSFPVTVEECCAVCNGCESEEFVIPDDCVGPRGNWITGQSTIVYRAIESRPVPFVLKSQETYGGAGTYIIRNEVERRDLIQLLRGGTLRRLLSTVNASNHHLGPATLLLSEVVQNPINDYGLTFFVADEGCDHIFLGASEQIIQDGNAWIGSTIDYTRQGELRDKFASLLVRIADWLRSHGYVGPAGADILETEGDEFHVVDLNVRTTGSLCLPLLRPHFMKRGLGHASSFSIDIAKTREQFICMFEQEFSEGKLCILSWYEDLKSGSSLANVAVGAEDEDSLKLFTQRLREASGNVMF